MLIQNRQLRTGSGAARQNPEPNTSEAKTQLGSPVPERMKVKKHEAETLKISRGEKNVTFK